MRNGLMALCLLSGAATAAGDAPAMERREPGTSILSIVVHGPRLAIDLNGPVTNFIGFGHPPLTSQETAELARAIDVLRAGNNLFLTPPEAYCQMDSVAVSPPAYRDATRAGAAKLAASWQFRCGNPAALIWVDARIFASFPDTAKLATSVVTPLGQKAVVLTPGTPRVLLPRSLATALWRYDPSTAGP